METLFKRPTTNQLIHSLAENCKGNSFFKTVWLLQHLHSDRPNVGHNGPMAAEVIRFRSNASLSFPIADVAHIELLKEDVTPKGEFALKKALFDVNFIGLYGSITPLPVFYTEDIIQGDPEKSTVRDFLDIFHHRLISYFYRSFEKYRYFYVYKSRAKDQFSNWMYSLIGLGHEKLREIDSVDWHRLLSFVGLLGMHSHSASTLESVISYYFGNIPVTVGQCIGKLISIEETERMQLGLKNCALGTHTTLGGHIYDRSSYFKLTIGPMDYKYYREFLPNGKNYATLRHLVQFILRDPLGFDVELLLKGGQIPGLLLESQGECQLGCSTWLGERLDETMTITQVGMK